MMSIEIILKFESQSSSHNTSSLATTTIMPEETLIPNPPNITLSDERIETLKPKPPPVKRGAQKFTNRKGKKKIETLLHNIKPKPFSPKKNLNLEKFERVLKNLGLFKFTRIQFDPVIRIELLVDLISNYDPKKKCSYVNGFRINVTKNDLARALKLPVKKPKKASAKTKDEVYSDEEIAFIEDFVFNWMLVSDEEIVEWARCIRDGHPEKMDAAKLIWYNFEKELTQGEKLVECYYASHLQCLIQSQRPSFFLEDYVGVGVTKEVVKFEDDIDEKEEVEEVKDEKDEKEVKDEKDGKDEKEEKDEKDDVVSTVKENDIQLNLGPDAEEIVHEEVNNDDVVMVDDVTDEVADEQGNWGLDGKNVLSDRSFLQRCQNRAYMETKAEEVEDDHIEQVDDDDEEEEEEEEEEEAGGERMDDGFGMQANDDSMDRDGVTGNFLQGVETSHIPYNNHGMSSMDLFGSTDNSFMDHGGLSFFNNGCKRPMDADDDMHHLDGNNKRLRTNDMLDQNQNDFGYCMEQMHQWMEKAKMLHESKEQNYANSQYNQQLAINQLQERQAMLELIIQSKDQELETKRGEVFRLERELFLMLELVSGLRGALKSTQAKFSDYRKRYHIQQKPLYQDAGPGGLVLSTREIEARKRKQEEDMSNIHMMANSLEREFVNQFKVHDENIMASADKLASVGNEFEKLKEMAAQMKETRKLQKSADKNQYDVSAEIEENQKSLDGNEFSAQIAENQKSLDGKELAADMEEKQEPMVDNEVGTEPEEIQKDEQAEVMETDAKPEGGPIDADEAKEKEGNEE